MKRTTHLIFLTALLLGLPLAGVVLFGKDAAEYLEFPPRTQYVEHAPFSWPVFIGLTVVIAVVVLPFIVRVFRSRSDFRKPSAVCFFPRWGWGGLVFGLVAWVLAWTRFEWFAPLQRYTFSPQWLAYIIVVNALTLRRTGRCLLTHRTTYFLSLFPLSAVFWWFFEYLNRFVQNWYYTTCEDFSGPQYLIAATLPFATVLPAVLSTEEWLASNPRNTAGLEHFLPIRLKRPRWIAGLTLLVSAAGLFLIGRFPDVLFPLLWLAPLLLLISFQCLEVASRDRHQIFQSLEAGSSCTLLFFKCLEKGDWRRVFRLCLAALICGFFWELWNAFSLAKWIYTVPYVNRFHLFEMPILGYSGYLPFGLECVVVGELFLNKARRERDEI